MVKNIMGLAQAPPTAEYRWHTETLGTTNNCAVFTKTVHIKYLPYYYEFIGLVVQETGQCELLPRSVLLHSQAVHFGQTSTAMTVTAIDHTVESKPELFTITKTLIEVDMETRMPMNNKASLGLDEKDYPKSPHPPRYDFPAPPSGVNLQTATDHVTDDVIDQNGHANMASYAAVFMKTVAENLKNSKYKTINETDHNKLHIKEFLMVYHRESLLGDVMETYTWEDDVTPGCIHGEVRRSNILLAQCTLLCNPRPSSNL